MNSAAGRGPSDAGKPALRASSESIHKLAGETHRDHTTPIPSMTTIQDVAREAEVSVSTVSNVLNGRSDRMRATTLARVEAAIAVLKFRPSKAAQQLKTGQTPLLGLLVPSMANPMYGYIAREVETFAQDRFGHRLLIG